ncbi:hypothetical protein ABPG72_013415 [Tetrahymena utriculariae]
MRVQILSVAVTIISLATAIPLRQDKVVVALDCGSSSPYKSSSDGITYTADNLYTQNTKIADYTYNQSIMKKTIKYTDDQQLYKTERHSDENFAYSLPAKEFGTYTLILKFCELYFTEPNKRVFSILFGDSLVVPEVDIVKEVGPFAAYDLYIEFEYKSDQIFYHNGKPCENALDTTHQGLIVEFRKIGKDLPKVDAIVLIKGGIAQSNYDEYQALIRNWNEEASLFSEDEQFQKLENLRKKIKDEFDTSIDFDAYNKGKFDGIMNILLSWKGLLILITLVIFQFCLFCSEDPQEAKIDRERKYSEEVQSPEKKDSSSTSKGESKKKKQ